MNNHTKNPSLRAAVVVAGIGLLVMTVLAAGSMLFIFESLIVSGDADATVNNILAGEMRFRIGIACFLIVAILDVVVAWALYVFLEPVNRYLSLLGAWFRLVYAAILGVSLFSYAGVLQLLNGAHPMQEGETGDLGSAVMLSLNAFDDKWAIGLIFFGMHLLILGYLVFKSGYAPKILGAILAAAGAAYMTDSLGRFLLPNLAINLAAFVGWGELLFMLWLLYAGAKGPIKRGCRDV